MPEPITGIDPQRLRAKLEEVREYSGEAVEILVATKYVLDDEFAALAEAGVTLVGENRATRSSGTSSATCRAAR